MLLLSKEMNEKDRSLKSQLLISSGIKSNEDKFTGKLAWQQNGFFGYKKVTLITVKNFPENIIYIYQGEITQVKGDLAIYN